MSPRIPEQEQLGPTIEGLDPPWVRMKKPELEEYKRREAEEDAERQAAVDAEVVEAETREQAVVEPAVEKPSTLELMAKTYREWKGAEPTPMSEQERLQRFEKLASMQEWLENVVPKPFGYVGLRGARYFFQPKKRAEILKARIHDKEINVDVPFPVQVGDEVERRRIDSKDFEPHPEAKTMWLSGKLKGQAHRDFVKREAIKKGNLDTYSTAQKQGFGKQTVYVGSDGASFYNPETEEYLWIPKDKIQKAADAGLFPENKERYLQRMGHEMYSEDEFGHFGAGTQMGGSFHLASLYYKAVLGPKEYKKAMGIAQEESPYLYGAGEIAGTVPWFFVGAGPVSLGAKGAAAVGARGLLSAGSRATLKQAMTKTAYRKGATRIFGEAALGAEIEAGAEFGKQVAEGKYDVGKILKKAGIGGAIYGGVGLAGSGVGWLAKKGASQVPYAGKIKELFVKGKDVGEAKIVMKAAESNAKRANDTVMKAEGVVAEAKTNLVTRVATAESSLAKLNAITKAEAGQQFTAEGAEVLGAAVTGAGRAAREMTEAGAIAKAAQAVVIREEKILADSLIAQHAANSGLTVAKTSLKNAQSVKGGIIKQLGVDWGKRIVAGSAFGVVTGGAPAYYKTGNLKTAAIAAAGSGVLLKPLGRRMVSRLGSMSAAGGRVAPIGEVVGKLAKGGKASLKIPFVRMTNEELFDTRENLSEDSINNWEENLMKGLKESGVDGVTAQKEVESATALMRLMNAYLPSSQKDTAGWNKYSKVLDTINNPQRILERMADFTLNEIDIAVMKALNPEQLNAWRDTARLVLKNKAYDLTLKQKRMYELLAGGKPQARLRARDVNINRLAFGAQEDAAKGSSLGDAGVPIQQSNIQRIEQGGLGSKPRLT